MAESDDSWSHSTLADNAEPRRTSVAGSEGFSLAIIVKSVELMGADRGGQVNISLKLDNHEAIVDGTVADIEKKRPENVMSIPSGNSQEFKTYLVNNDLEISVRTADQELAKATVSLVNLTAFDPPSFESFIVPYTVGLSQDEYTVGTIKLILKTDRTQSNFDLTARTENDSVIYVVNDTPERRSVELQEDTMRQLLTCGMCNVSKSSSELSFHYELIDGILVNREQNRKDPDLETMQRKLEQIERKAKLYPVGKEPEPLKEPEPNRFRKGCGGYYITGETCESWKKTGPYQTVPTDTSVQRNSTRSTEPNFSGTNYENFRSRQRSGSIQLKSTQQQHGPNYVCPQSVRTRFCQRCGLNLNWLPLQSSCPKCGHQSAPYSVREPAAQWWMAGQKFKKLLSFFTVFVIFYFIFFIY